MQTAETCRKTEVAAVPKPPWPWASQKRRKWWNIARAAWAARARTKISEDGCPKHEKQQGHAATPEAGGAMTAVSRNHRHCHQHSKGW